MLTREQWVTLTRLYVADRRGIEHDGTGYGAAGSWDAIKALRDHTPTLAREVTQLDPHNEKMRYLVVITDAGRAFYERKRRQYRVLYPPSEPSEL